MRERKKSVTGRSASVGSKRSSRADMALGNANGASTMVVGATMQVFFPPVISFVPCLFDLIPGHNGRSRTGMYSLATVCSLARLCSLMRYLDATVATIQCRAGAS